MNTNKTIKLKQIIQNKICKTKTIKLNFKKR